MNPALYHRATIFLSNLDSEATEFLVSKIGIEKTNQIYQRQIPEVFWRVRYFRDSDAEEFVVLFRANGEFHSFWHTLDERTAGAKLAKDDAMKLAQDWLRANKQIDFSAWRLVDAKSENPPNRVDHTLVWEQTAPLAGGPKAEDEAFARLEIHVRGNEVSDISHLRETSGAVGARSRTRIRLEPFCDRCGRTYFFIGVGGVCAGLLLPESETSRGHFNSLAEINLVWRCGIHSVHHRRRRATGQPL